MNMILKLRGSVQNPRLQPSGKRSRRSQVPCAIHDGGIYKKGVEVVRFRAKFGMEASTEKAPVQFAVEALMEKAPDKPISLCNRDGGIHGQSVEAVTFRVQLADGGLNAKGAGSFKVPCHCAIHHGRIHEKDVEVVRFRAESAIEAIMETAPEKSGSLCNPRWRIS